MDVLHSQQERSRERDFSVRRIDKDIKETSLSMSWAYPWTRKRVEESISSSSCLSTWSQLIRDYNFPYASRGRKSVNGVVSRASCSLWSELVHETRTTTWYVVIFWQVCYLSLWVSQVLLVVSSWVRLKILFLSEFFRLEIFGMKNSKFEANHIFVHLETNRYDSSLIMFFKYHIFKNLKIDEKNNVDETYWSNFMSADSFTFVNLHWLFLKNEL